MSHLFQREDVVTERKLRKTAVEYGIGCVMPDDVNREIAGALERGEILRKDGKQGAQYVKASTPASQCRMTQHRPRGQGAIRAPDRGVSRPAGAVGGAEPGRA